MGGGNIFLFYYRFFLIFLDSKINAMFCLLEAFCCIQTVRNDVANRFINIFLLEFGNTGQIVSLLLQVNFFCFFFE
jgi:hypothetical protein